MKKLEAVIRPNKLDAVKVALVELGILGMTIHEVHGLGRAVGHTEVYRGVEYQVDFLPRIKLEIIVEEDKVQDCMEIITDICRTGNLGDGKIFISSIDSATSIRTGETDINAIY